MTGLDKNQIEVERILFGLRAAEGFTLAGGSGAVPGDVLPLSVDLTAALTEADWVVTRVRSHTTFARLGAARDEASVEIDLAVDSPPLSCLRVSPPQSARHSLSGARSFGGPPRNISVTGGTGIQHSIQHFQRYGP